MMLCVPTHKSGYEKAKRIRGLQTAPTREYSYHLDHPINKHSKPDKHTQKQLYD